MGSRAVLTARLSAATRSGGRAAMSRAQAVASPISASGATTEESRPSRWASAASTVRPVSSRSRAPLSKSSRESWTLDAMRPTLTPTAPSLARVEPTRTSHQSASTRPPPIAQPLTAATIGRSYSRSARNVSSPAFRNLPTVSAVSSSSSLRSAPPQNARSPAPVSTTARAPASRNSASASRMPRRFSSLSTFIGGLSSTMVPTGPSVHQRVCALSPITRP